MSQLDGMIRLRTVDLALAMAVVLHRRSYVAAPDVFKNLSHRGAARGRAQGEQIVENAAQGKNIAAFVLFLNAAFRLLEGGWVDVLCSDFHGRSHLSTFVPEIRSWFAERELDEVFEILTVGNPGRMLADEHPDAVPSVTLDRGLWDRITGFLRSGDA